MLLILVYCFSIRFLNTQQRAIFIQLMLTTTTPKKKQNLTLREKLIEYFMEQQKNTNIEYTKPVRQCTEASRCVYNFLII